MATSILCVYIFEIVDNSDLKETTPGVSARKAAQINLQKNRRFK
jgi:hypothetical protein